jgi:hypothetical protein
MFLGIMEKLGEAKAGLRRLTCSAAFPRRVAAEHLPHFKSTYSLASARDSAEKCPEGLSGRV